MTKKLLSLLLSAALTATGIGMPGWVHAVKIVGDAPSTTATQESAPQVTRMDAVVANNFFQRYGVFEDKGGEKDVLRSYMFDSAKNGATSAYGDVFYQILTAQDDRGVAPDAETIRNRIKELRENFDALRALGEATPVQLLAAEDEIEDVKKKHFGAKFQELTSKIHAGKAVELPLRAMFNAAYDGAMGAAQREKKEYVQVETPSGYSFYDEKGEAIRLSKNIVCRHNDWAEGTEPIVMSVTRFGNFKKEQEGSGQYKHWKCQEGGGATIFNRDLQVQQQKMNDPKTRPSCAPEIPLTGRYNYEMLLHSKCKVEEQSQQLELDYVVKRMQKLATMTGGNYATDQFVKDGKYDHRLLKTLEEAAKKKSLEGFTEKDESCPGVKNALEYVDCRFKESKSRLDKAKKAVAEYAARIKRFEGRHIITDSDIKGLQTDEQFISLKNLKTFISSSEQQVTTQMEVLSREVKFTEGEGGEKKFVDVVKIGGTGKSWLTEWDWKAPGLPEKFGGTGILPFKWKEYESPDSKQLRDNLKSAPWDETVQNQYLERGSDLAYRLGRLRLVLHSLDKQLDRTDHETGLGSVNAVLQSVQGELNDVNLDLSIYATLPALAKVAAEESQGWGDKLVYWGHQGVNAVSRAFFDGSHGRQYIQDRKTIEDTLPAFKGMAEMISDGKFSSARKALIALNPDAVQSTWRASVFGSPVGEPTDPMRVQASLEKAQKAIMRHVQRNMLAGAVANTVLWSVALGVAAPAASVVISGVGRSMMAGGARLASTAGKVAFIARPIGYAMKATGAIFEHFALRLQSLSPAADRLYANAKIMRLAEATAIRSLNAGIRIGSFAGLAGGISGGFGAAAYGYDKFLGEGHNPMPSAWEAASVSFKHGAKWATDSWHPLILFAGLPSTAFEGIPVLGGAATTAAGQGVLGASSTGLRALGGAGGGVVRRSVFGGQVLDKVVRARSAMANTWAGQKMLGLARGIATNPVFVFADHIAKFMVVSQGAGFAARRLSLNYNTIDEGNIERRIQRSEQAAMHHMEAPWWLLLPVGSARTELQQHSHARTMQGVKEYMEAGEGHRLAEMIPEVTELALKNKPKVSIMQWLFNASIRGEKGNTGVFKITKELHQQVIRDVLPGEIEMVRGGKIIPAAEKHIPELYEIARGNRKTVGRLKVSDIVIDQAGELLNLQIGKSVKLRRSILEMSAEQLGKKIRGFGTVDLKVQKEFARSVWRNRHNSAYNVSAKERAFAQQILAAELKTEGLVDVAAIENLRALKANGNPSKEFKTIINEFLEEITAWKNRDSNLVKQHGQDYMSLMNTLKKRVEHLSTAEKNAVYKTTEYLQAIRDRFQYFNRVDRTIARAQSGLRSHANQMKDGTHGPEVSRMLKKMQSELSAWRGKQKSEKAPAGESYEAMASRLSQEVQALKGKIPDHDYAFLEGAVGEMKASPWILRDSKGNSLPDWRPEQFEGLMYFLGSVMSKGTEAASITRLFLMMKTGAGKTFLAYEGLLPMVEAAAKDAKVGGLKTIFLTVQSNLESQARIEFRAMNKLRTGLEFDTWEGFKSRIAQGKLDSGMKAEDYFILGDEMDGAALQPALTIGETTASVPRWSVGYQKLRPTFTRMREVLSRGPRRLKNDMGAAVIRRQTMLESLAEGARKQEMSLAVENLSRMTQKLAHLHTRFYTPVNGRAEVLSAARAALTRVLGRGRTIARGGKAPTIPRHRLQAKINALTQESKFQQTLMENPKAFLAARRGSLTAQLEGAWKLLGWSKKSGSLSQQVKETVSALERQSEAAHSSGDITGSLKLEGQARALRTLFKSLEGLEVQAAAFGKDAGKARADIQAKITQLTKELGSLREAGTLSETVARTKKTPLSTQARQTIEALLKDAKRFREAGKTKQAEKAEAKAKLIENLNEAVARLEEVQTGTGPRRDARRLRQLADNLEKETLPGRREVRLEELREHLKQVEGGKTSTEPARDARRIADTLDQKADAREQKVRETVEHAQKKLREVFETDLAFEKDLLTRKIRSETAKQNERMTRIDKKAGEQFAESSKEIGELLDKQEASVRTNKTRALELQRDMIKQEKAILAGTQPAGSKVAQRLRKIAAKAKSEGRTADARRMEAQADRIVREGWQVRKDLRENSQEIQRTIEEGQPGWENAARELLRKREGLVERAVEKENPVYEIFREMRESMYSHVHSRYRITQEFQTLENGPRSARETLRINGAGSRKQVKALIKELKTLKAKGTGGADIDMRIKEAQALLKKVDKNAQALYRQRRDIREFESKAQSDRHESLMKAGKEQQAVVDQAEVSYFEAREKVRNSPKKDPVLDKNLKQAEQNYLTANDTLKEINSKLLEFNAGRRRNLEAKIKGFEAQSRTFAKDVDTSVSRIMDGWTPSKDGAPVRRQAQAIMREMQSAQARWRTERMRLNMTPTRAEQILARRINGVSTPKILMAYALEAPRLAIANLHRVPVLGRIPGVQGLSSWASSTWKGVAAKEGLTRYYARRLLWNFLRDPLISPQVRWQMFWTLLPSTVFSRGIVGPSWVQGELLNLARGYLEPARTIRFDHGTGKVNVVDNGQWFESMDNPTRRFWELEYGSDLTLPYDSKTIATIKDITTNTKVRFIGFSGTAGKEFRARLTPHKIEMTGHGSVGVEKLDLEIHATPTGKMDSIMKGLRRNLLHDFRQIDAGAQADSLLVLSLPDTRVVKQVTQHLFRNGVRFTRGDISPKVLSTLRTSGYHVSLQGGEYWVRLQGRHLSKVISDSELLRTQMPQSNIEGQMNLDGLTPGDVKILMLDTRVGGRGLDLNFKGQKGAGPFEGYNHFEMQIHDPQVASEAHFLQAQGRIDLGRVRTGAYRAFRMVMDVPSSANEVVFLKMLRDEPLMTQLRQRPEVVKQANRRGKIHPEWVDVHHYIESLNTRMSAAHARGQLTPTEKAQARLIENYRRMVRRNLDGQMLEVEKDQLRSSSVLQDQAMFNWLMRGLHPSP